MSPGPGTIPSEPFEDSSVQNALESIMEIDGVEYAGLWLADEEPVDPVMLHNVGRSPLGSQVREHLSGDFPSVRSLLAHKAFNWVVAAEPIGRADAHPGSGSHVVFAVDRRVLLEVGISGSAGRIASDMHRIHDALQAVSRSLRKPPPSAALSSSGNEPIDLEYLQAAGFGDRDFIRQILGIAEAELEQALQALREHALAGDRSQVGVVAHRIRSTAGTIGARLLDDRMASVEERCADAPSLGELIQPAVDAAEDVLEALRQHTR